MRITTDYLVIGSGVAGLTFALEAAANGDVLVVTKRSADESNTKYAQGGIAAVLSAGDALRRSRRGHPRAGAGLCRARGGGVCEGGPARIKMLRDVGARFDAPGRRAPTAPTSICISRRPGARRVAHAADMTGREVERSHCSRRSRDRRACLLEGHTAVDLITMKALHGGPEVCSGAFVLDESSGKLDDRPRACGGARYGWGGQGVPLRPALTWRRATALRWPTARAPRSPT